MPLITEKQLIKLCDFFSILETNGVRYIVLRGYKDLPERIRTDLDIACHPNDETKFYELARTHLECDSFPYVSQINGREIVYWDFFISDSESPKPKIRMDLYNGIYWFHGRQYHPDGDITMNHIFNNRIKNKWFYVPSLEIDVVFNILRCVYDKKTGIEDKKIGTKYRLIVENLFPQCLESRLVNTFKKFFPRLGTIAPHLFEETVDLIKNRDYPGLTKMIMRLRTH